jgi:putative sterol carrier protein
MSVKFLSPEWAAELAARLNADPKFAEATAGRSVTIQQTITSEDGPVDYWLTLDGGVVALGLGTADDPTATIIQDYATAVGLARREVNPVTAFLFGRIKIEGGLGPLMDLQPALGLLADHMAEMDIEF